MSAGREMDILIAEKIFGWKRKIYPPDSLGTLGSAVWEKPGPHRPHIMTIAGMPNYSTEISAAWEVVEKLNSLGWNVCVASRIDGQYACFVTKQAAEDGSAPYRESAPMAICLAALEARERG